MKLWILLNTISIFTIPNFKHPRLALAWIFHLAQAPPLFLLLPIKEARIFVFEADFYMTRNRSFFSHVYEYEFLFLAFLNSPSWVFLFHLFLLWQSSLPCFVQKHLANDKTLAAAFTEQPYQFEVLIFSSFSDFRSKPVFLFLQ